MQSKPGQPIICGDFNFHVDDSTDPAANKFKDVYKEKGFTQHNAFATHGNSTLDLVLTCNAICDQVHINELKVINDTPSDHSLVCFQIPVISKELETEGTTTSAKEIRMLSQIDVDQFKKEIIENMPDPADLTSLVGAVESYHSVLSALLDKHAPAKTVTFRQGKIHGGHPSVRRLEQHAEWLNADIKETKKLTLLIGKSLMKNIRKLRKKLLPH